MAEKQYKILLSEDEIPRHWYNIQADMPNKPLPPLHPGTKQPVGPADLSSVVSDGTHQAGSLTGPLH